MYRKKSTIAIEHHHPATSTYPKPQIMSAIAAQTVPVEEGYVIPQRQQQSLKALELNATDPDLFAILDKIKVDLLNFTDRFPESDIVPCLVGSKANALHPESLPSIKINPYDVDWHILCHIKSNEANKALFIQALNKQISFNKFCFTYFSQDISSKTMHIACEFDFKNNTKVDVKFTISTEQTIAQMLDDSTSERMIGPKATITTFPMCLAHNSTVTIFYSPTHLDFTTTPYCPRHRFKYDVIAYALFFLHQNPDYPKTDRFIGVIKEFNEECKHNKELLEKTVQEFIRLNKKKKHLSDEKQIMIAFHVLVEQINAITKTTRQENPRNPISRENSFFHASRREAANKIMNSFLEALISLMKQSKHAGLTELGEYPVETLESKLHFRNTKFSIDEIIQSFLAQYPDIHVAIFKKQTAAQPFMPIFYPKYHEASRPWRFTLAWHENQYVPIVAHYGELKLPPGTVLLPVKPVEETTALTPRR